MKLIIAAALTLMTTLAHADLKSDVAQIEATNKACSDKAISNNDMKQCAFSAQDAYDKLLNVTYKKIVAALKAAIPQEKKDGPTVGGKTYSEETLNRLVVSERAWVTFRDAQCSLESTEMLGGTGEGLIIGGCLGDQTKDRILSLDSILGSGVQQ